MPVSDQGASFDRYGLIPRTLIFLTRGERVLLLRGSVEKRLWPNHYNGVGGHIERGEDVLSAARRELKEETGLQADWLRLVGTITIDAGPQVGIVVFVFKGECAEGDPHPSDEGSLEWIPFGKIANYPLVEDLYTILPRILILQPDDPPFSYHYHYDDEDKLVIEEGFPLA